MGSQEKLPPDSTIECPSLDCVGNNLLLSDSTVMMPWSEMSEACSEAGTEGDAEAVLELPWRCSEDADCP